MLTAATLSDVSLYVESSDALRAEVRSNLMRTAAVGAALVDGDLHRTFTSPAPESTQAYNQALAPLRRVQRARPDISYVLHLRLHRGKSPVGTGPGPAGRLRWGRSGRPRPHHGGLSRGYPSHDRGGQDRDMTADEEIVTDKWGTFLSGYAPAITYIKAGAGTQLETQCVDAFLAALPQILETKERFQDQK